MIRNIVIMLGMILFACPVYAQSEARDPGEAAAQKQFRASEKCTTTPVYSQVPVAIDKQSGDPEKDTVAYTVQGTKTICWDTKITDKDGNEPGKMAGK